MITMILKFILLLITITFSCSLITNPIVSYTSKFKSLPEVKVMEPKNINHKDSSCLVFFTGGSSLILSDVYNNFLNKVASHNISIYTPSYNYIDIDDLISELDNEYKEVILAGHSSGCSVALKNSKNDKLKKLILLDPVKTELFSQEPYNLKNLESILFLNAMKSYKFNIFPLGIPFIPDFVSLKKEDLNLDNNCKILNCEATSYGHCDILDKVFSDKMHESRIAIGSKNRDEDHLNKYQEWTACTIDNYLQNKKIKKDKY